MKIYTGIIFSVMVLMSCHQNSDQEKGKNALIKSEKAFETMVSEKGLAEAFYYFADSNAVIKRENDILIVGKENIKKYYSTSGIEKVNLTWKPDFIEVSKDGTLGYTYGKYVMETVDSAGNNVTYRGVFHTVWKKQADGNWKYVWD
jgi:ketosteroid isomerase-like protein